MNEQTILTAFKIAQAMEADPTIPTVTPSPVHSVTPEWVVVRGDRSGVFFGLMVARNGQEVSLADARHIWYWSGAANTAEMANKGVSKPNECKFVAPVARLLVLDAIEVLTCTEAARQSLSAVPEWSKR